MSAHEQLDSLRAEMDGVISEMEYLTGKLRELRRKQHEMATARLVASPRVVAGPLSFLEHRLDQAEAQRRSPEEARRMMEAQFPGAVLTHATCGIPCGGMCADDDPPGTDI